MPTYLTPGVYFESVDDASLGIASIRTDVAAFVGVAAQGPLHKATAVESWAQFQSAFGNFLPNAYLAYAAKAFFENGGQKLYIVRVAAPKATTSTGSAVLQPADGSASVVLSTEGFAVGGVATASQTVTAIAAGVQPADRLSSLVDTASGFPERSLVQVTQAVPFVQAWHRVQAADAATKRLYWTSPLEPSFLLTSVLTFSSFHQKDLVIAGIAANTITWLNGLGDEFNVAQAIEFDTGVSRARGVFHDSAATGTLSVEAATPGSWGDALQVSVSYASLAATMTASSAQTHRRRLFCRAKRGRILAGVAGAYLPSAGRPRGGWVPQAHFGKSGDQPLSMGREHYAAIRRDQTDLLRDFRFLVYRFPGWQRERKVYRALPRSTPPALRHQGCESADQTPAAAGRDALAIYTRQGSRVHHPLPQ